MIVTFFLYIIETGDIIYVSAQPPINFSWQETGIVVTGCGALGGINWDVVGAFYNEAGVTLPTPTPEQIEQLEHFSAGIWRYDATTGEVSLA